MPGGGTRPQILDEGLRVTARRDADQEKNGAGQYRSR